MKKYVVLTVAVILGGLYIGVLYWANSVKRLEPPSCYHPVGFDKIHYGEVTKSEERVVGNLTTAGPRVFLKNESDTKVLIMTIRNSCWHKMPAIKLDSGAACQAPWSVCSGPIEIGVKFYTVRDKTGMVVKQTHIVFMTVNPVGVIAIKD